MNASTIAKVLGMILEMKFIEGYRSQILGAAYAGIVLAQGFGLLESFWDMAEMAKGVIVGLMPMTMAAKITKARVAAEGSRGGAQ